MKVEVRVWSGNIMRQLAEWDMIDDSRAYESSVAKALYKALGVSPGDEEYSLAQHSDGRLALIGMTVEGHRYAVESGPCENCCGYSE